LVFSLLLLLALRRESFLFPSLSSVRTVVDSNQRLSSSVVEQVSLMRPFPQGRRRAEFAFPDLLGRLPLFLLPMHRRAVEHPLFSDGQERGWEGAFPFSFSLTRNRFLSPIFSFHQDTFFGEAELDALRPSFFFLSLKSSFPREANRLLTFLRGDVDVSRSGPLPFFSLLAWPTTFFPKDLELIAENRLIFSLAKKRRHFSSSPPPPHASSSGAMRTRPSEAAG